MRLFSTISAVLLLSAISFPSACLADQIGNPATSAPNSDGCTSCGFILDQPFAASGTVLSSYSYYAASTSGTLTAALFSRTGNTYTVTGIGTAVAPTSLGMNTTPFTLASGSAVVGANSYFGFLNSNPSGGIVAFAYSGAGNGGTLVLPNNPVIAVGQSFTPGTTPVNNAYDNLNNRTYSINATSVAMPPPPVVVGNPVVNGTNVDECTDCGFVLDQPFASANLRVASYTYYAKIASGTVTPVLLTRTGNTFTITGIGASSTPTHVGANTFLYTPTFGSANTTAKTYFGFVSQDASGGIVSFNYTGAGNGGTFVLPNNPTIAGGASFLENVPSVDNAYDYLNNRAYNVSATAVAPEPGTLSLLTLGMATVAGFVRRRR